MILHFTFVHDFYICPSYIIPPSGGRGAWFSLEAVGLVVPSVAFAAIETLVGSRALQAAKCLYIGAHFHKIKLGPSVHLPLWGGREGFPGRGIRPAIPPCFYALRLDMSGQTCHLVGVLVATHEADAGNPRAVLIDKGIQ